MQRLRLLPLSLLILGILLVLILAQPLTGSERYTEEARQNIVKTQDGWVLRYELTNSESADAKYHFKLSINGEESALTISTKTEKSFTYEKIIPAGKGGVLTLSINKDGESTPLEVGVWQLGSRGEG